MNLERTHPMKTKSIITIAAIALLPLAAFTQTPPVPPPPPGPPPTGPVGPGADRERREKKVPVTYLGVETSDVPRVVSEQLGLPKGFGLVVDYVVPDGPAAAAGVQQNDILRMLNDQILTEPDQLSKLVRSFPEGTNVTLTILRKNAEQKVTVKLGKHEVRQRDHDFGFNFNMDGFNEKMQAFNEKMNDFKFDSNFGPDIRETVRNAQRESARSVREAQREATRATREAQREAQRNAREMRVF